MKTQPQVYIVVVCFLFAANVEWRGVPCQVQEIELRKKPDVIVATPGRMLDHLRNAHGKCHIAHTTFDHFQT